MCQKSSPQASAWDRTARKCVRPRRAGRGRTNSRCPLAWPRLSWHSVESCSRPIWPSSLISHGTAGTSQLRETSLFQSIHGNGVAILEPHIKLFGDPSQSSRCCTALLPSEQRSLECNRVPNRISLKTSVRKKNRSDRILGSGRIPGVERVRPAERGVCPF